MPNCHQCQTSLPEGAKFCFNCGAPQLTAPPPPDYLDLSRDVERQLTDKFFSSLQKRLAVESLEGALPQFSERIYTSGFRDMLQRRIQQVAESFQDSITQKAADQLLFQRRAEMLFSDLIDLFFVSHCADLLTVPLPEQILKYQGTTWPKIDVFYFLMDYLDFHNENITVHTDFLKMPVNHLKNAGKYFLFPEKEELIYFICDQSLLGGCQEGFAMTQKGLYWKAPLEKAHKVSYSAINSLKLYKEWLTVNDHFFNAGPSLNVKLIRLLSRIQFLFSMGIE